MLSPEKLLPCELFGEKWGGWASDWWRINAIPNIAALCTLMPSVDALVKVPLAALRAASKLPFNAWKALGTSKMDWQKKKKRAHWARNSQLGSETDSDPGYPWGLVPWQKCTALQATVFFSKAKEASVLSCETHHEGAAALLPLMYPKA